MIFLPINDAYMIKLRRLQYIAAHSNLSEIDRDLRGNAYRDVRERWHGALFAYALAKSFGLTDMQCAWCEDQACEHDVTLRFRRNGDEHENHIQLKEMPPEKLNPGLTIEEFFENIASKNYRSKTLTIACFLNRNMPKGEFAHPLPKVAQLFMFGWGEPDQRSILLQGDLLSDEHDETYMVPYPGYDRAYL